MSPSMRGRNRPHTRGRRALLAVGLVTAVTATAVVVPSAPPAEAASTLSAFDAVNQFIGTEMNDGNTGRGNDHYGNTFPGATVPFGMVQSSPTTYETATKEQYGGYEYQADQIRGFGMTRLSGTGCRSNYGGFDFPVIPFTGDQDPAAALPSNPAGSIGDYFLDFSHENEDAEPGYYSVDLDAGVGVELTSTTRTAVSRYSFDDSATLLFDAAGSNNQVRSATVEFDPATGELSGSVTANIVCNGGDPYTAYFSATFDQPVTGHGTWDGDSVDAGSTTASGSAKHAAGAWLRFADGADVTATVGLSYVSVDGARLNAETEAGDAGFDATRAGARATWEEALGTIDATGGTERDRTTMYSALYHALLHPNTFQDVDGRYTGYDKKVHQLEEGRDFYVNFSGWDTYRGQAQLLALLFPERASDINQSIVDMVAQTGRWTSWPSYNSVQTKMSGDSLQNIIAATDDFGATDYDRATALSTMLATQTLPMAGSARSDAVQYGTLGWVDGDKQGAATSRTLEYATNDFAIAQLAKRLGDEEAYQAFSTRSQNWRNVFNPATQHIDARNRNGFMNTSLTTQGAQFEQSTGLQYGFNVAHNMAALIEARGGVEAATTDLDALLRDLDGGAFSDTAYIANQPSFGLPWVYNWLQAPHKTTDTLYRVAEEMFTTEPDGLYGNDDLGSFSAWYVWANLGLMPATWGTADLLVSAPMFERIVIDSVGSDRTITIDAPGAGDEAKYTTALSVNGTAQTASWLTPEFARTGGTLDFTMSATPGSWGTGAEDVPPSYDEGSDARNAVGITDDGAANMGGLDAGGTGLSRQDLEKAGVTGGASIPFGKTGVSFTWPDTTAGEPDHWIPSGQVLDFGDVQASGISFLGLATNGPSRGTATVTYSDGTTKAVDVRLSDWVPGNVEGGNVRLVDLTKRNTVSGGSDSAKPTLFATSVVPLDPAKKVRSVTLPTQVSKGIMHVFDVALRPVDEDNGGEEPALPSRPDAGETIPSTIPEPEDVDGTALIGADTVWRVHDGEKDPAAGLPAKTDWTAAAYDDSAWTTGTTSFGAKNGAIASLGGGFTPTTLLSQYKADRTNVEAFFFRTTVELTEQQLAQTASLSGEIAYDDAARVYVNGTLVQGFADDRIDASETSNMVYAGGNGSAPLTGTFTVPAELLTAGANTIAVQVHNTNDSSSDVFMQLSSLTIDAADTPATISDVLLHVGTDETARNLTFYTDREVPAKVQIAPASARTGTGFPEAQARIIDADTSATRDGRFSNQVVIDGLDEATSYLYRVGNEDMGWSRSYELWTGTFEPSYSFVYLTDAQIGASGNWQNDRDRWAASLDQIDQFERDASMIVSGGDQVESHRSENEYASFIAPELLTQLPFQATIGNHDNQSDQFNSHFFTPNRSTVHGYESTEGRAGGDYWYTYNDVLYLNINTNARSANEEDHAAFLREVMAEQGEAASWVVVVMHHSLYSAAFHSVEQDVVERRQALAPVFSELGVDLVLAGHDHIYTRSYLMDGTTPVGDRAAQEESGVTLSAEEGQVLYVTGNSASGSKFYGLDASSPEAAVKDQSNQPQYTDVDVSPTALTLTTYQTMDRTVIDEVTLTRATGDEVAPEFSGLEAETEVAQGQSFEPLAGVTASDDVDGELTAAIEVTGAVDTTTPGEYRLEYRVSDAAGNVTTAERVVTVVAVAPTFSGVPPTREVVAGEEFDELAGISAMDANGADLTDRITVERVEPGLLARMFVADDADGFTLRYSVTDDYGTSATAETVVTVADSSEPGGGDEDGGSDGGADGGAGSGSDGGSDGGSDTGSDGGSDTGSDGGAGSGSDGSGATATPSAPAADGSTSGGADGGGSETGATDGSLAATGAGTAGAIALAALLLLAAGGALALRRRARRS